MPDGESLPRECLVADYRGEKCLLRDIREDEGKIAIACKRESLFRSMDIVNLALIAFEKLVYDALYCPGGKRFLRIACLVSVKSASIVKGIVSVIFVPFWVK